MDLFLRGLVITSCFYVAGTGGAAADIQVRAGDTAVLHFNTGNISLENLALDVQRPDLNFTDLSVYVYSFRGGEENFEPQLDSYKDRVFMDHTCLPSGVLCLGIRNTGVNDSGEYLLTVPKLRIATRLVLQVNEAEMTETDGNGFNTTTAEGASAKAWFSVIPVAAVIIIIIIAVLLKIRPWSPKDGEKRPSNEMI